MGMRDGRLRGETDGRDSRLTLAVAGPRIEHGRAAIHGHLGVNWWRLRQMRRASAGIGTGESLYLRGWVRLGQEVVFYPRHAHYAPAMPPG